VWHACRVQGVGHHRGASHGAAVASRSSRRVLGPRQPKHTQSTIGSLSVYGVGEPILSRSVGWQRSAAITRVAANPEPGVRAIWSAEGRRLACQMNIIPTPLNPFEVNLDALSALSPMERTLRSVRAPLPTQLSCS
jgi:hypothetical protein